MEAVDRRADVNHQPAAVLLCQQSPRQRERVDERYQRGWDSQPQSTSWGKRSRVADATAAVAGRVVGAAVKGVIGGIQGTRKGSQSVAGRPGEAWVKGVIGGIQGVLHRICSSIR